MLSFLGRRLRKYNLKIGQKNEFFTCLEPNPICARIRPANTQKILNRLRFLVGEFIYALEVQFLEQLRNTNFLAKC